MENKVHFWPGFDLPTQDSLILFYRISDGLPFQLFWSYSFGFRDGLHSCLLVFTRKQQKGV